MQTPQTGLVPEIVLILGPEANHAQLRIALVQHLQGLPGMALADLRVHQVGLTALGQIPRRGVQIPARPGKADPKPALYRSAAAQGLDAVHLPENPPDILQEHRTPVRGRHAPAGPLKYGKAQTLLQLVNHPAQIRLAEKEILGRLGDGPRPLNLHQVLKMLGIHGEPSPLRQFVGISIISYRYLIIDIVLSVVKAAGRIPALTKRQDFAVLLQFFGDSHQFAASSASTSHKYPLRRKNPGRLGAVRAQRCLIGRAPCSSCRFPQPQPHRRRGRCSWRRPGRCWG